MTEKKCRYLDLPLEVLFNQKENKSLSKFLSANITTIKNLLDIWPNSIIKAPKTSAFITASPGDLFRGKGKIIKILKRPSFSNHRFKKKIPLFGLSVVVCEEETNLCLNLHWFNCYPSVVKKIEGLSFIEFQGEVKEFNHQKQIANPIFDTELADLDLLYSYPTYRGITPLQIKTLLNKIPDLGLEQIDDPLPIKTLEKNDFPTLKDCYKAIHARGEFKNLEHRENILKSVERRFSYDLFFDQQLKLLTRRNRTKSKSIERLIINPQQLDLITKALGLELTTDQKTTLGHIFSDFKSGHPMMRLLQGDVGCGKTAIAFIASAVNCFNKKQSAIMCPTETLAEQHFHSIYDFAQKLNLRCRLWTGGQKAKDKKEFLEKLEEGEIDLVIGTHALIQSDIKFKKLNFVVIDEQHKFGVKQRLVLSQKAEGCHTLTMTATPIPRSLTLIRFGDLDVSVIKEMPTGRKGHKTRIIDPSNFYLFLNFLKTRISLGEQAYLVVPAIEENEGHDLLNLEKVMVKFRAIFSDLNIQGLHGKMKSTEKSSVLSQFMAGTIQILIATSVVEVGINNPKATIMAIMNPERFGLSSLHQLRGRVGRGTLPGFCFLICDKKLSLLAMNRLRVIEKSTDGFKIAEEDLKIRGHGDLFGTNQSGEDSSFEQSLKHLDLLEVAKIDAELEFRELHQTSLPKHQHYNKYQNDPIVIQTT